MVDWNTGQRVHRPKKGKGSYNREVVKWQDGSLQKSN
jgi:stalled ribosome alternative rescue factor ArfA